MHNFLMGLAGHVRIESSYSQTDNALKINNKRLNIHNPAILSSPRVFVKASHKTLIRKHDEYRLCRMLPEKTEECRKEPERTGE